MIEKRLTEIKKRQEIRQQMQVCEVCGHCLDPGEKSPQDQLMLLEMVEFLQASIKKHSMEIKYKYKVDEIFNNLEKIAEKYKEQRRSK